jgi:predicted dehydrogenase
MAWAMGDEPPVKVTAVGGRTVRNEPEYGHIYDNFSTVYEYASGAKGFCTTRQQNGCDNNVSDHITGTKGVCDVFKYKTKDFAGKPLWRFREKRNNMYQAEHDEFFAGIRNGEPINNGEYMTRSTLIAIMGRMSAYTGKTITWEQALNSKENLNPPTYDWISMDVPPVAVPGVTQFS